MASYSSDSQSCHVVLFPFMAKGHTIPLLNFARLLRRRFHRLSVAIFTTEANHPFISQFLSDADSVSIIDLPFPNDIPGVPSGVESIDKLPSLALLYEFIMATKRMQQEFEKQLQVLPRVSFIVSDSFLWWTLESASKFGIPRFSFSGMSNYTGAVTVAAVYRERLIFGPESDEKLITVKSFPWIKITRSDWEPVFMKDSEKNSLDSEFMILFNHSTSNSYGSIVNSFYELEPVFFDYINNDELGWPNAHCVGPLCLVEKPKAHRLSKPTWLEWLDQKQREGKSVLYVAFGSQADISLQQLEEIAIGLEESQVNFLWAKKGGEPEEEDGFEERVRERGMVVREWVDQWEILKHETVKGFLSHCGWNSVLESICCGVPILAWPLMADQALNARMVVEEIKVGLRAVETCGGSIKGFLKRNELEKKVRELMEGDEGKQVRKKALEFSEMAKKAMEEEGSSWKTLGRLLEDMWNDDEDKDKKIK